MKQSVHLVCPLCQSVNRLSLGRLNDHPNCGRCKHDLFNASPVELNKASFERNLARNDIPLLVDFWAPWCGPCVSMASAFKQASAQLEPLLRLAKVNTEAEPEISSRFSIRSIPTMILFKGGQEIKRHSGAMGVAQIAAWAKSAV